MNRRQFSGRLAIWGAWSMLPSAAFSGAPDSGTNAVTNEARQLYRNSLVLDCNSAPTDDNELQLPMSQPALNRVRESGVNAIKWSLGGIDSGFVDTMAEIAPIFRLLELHPTYFTQIRVAEDLARAKREGRLGLILSFESVEMLEGRLDRLELFRDLGVRVMQLSYNRRSPFANGVMEPDAVGLTSLGREAVRRMNALGIAIDLSHANEAATSDVIALSSKPAVITHAGCTAIHPHPRNKSDEQLRALAARGGVVGIYDLMYLVPSPKQATLDDYMRHVVHALDVAGEDHVGVGSDVSLEPFDTSADNLAKWMHYVERRQTAGLAAPEEDRPPYVEGLNTPRRMEIIADSLLRRGYPARVVEKVLGANFVRALGEIWGT
jgi:membrane dipeptidase